MKPKIIGYVFTNIPIYEWRKDMQVKPTKTKKTTTKKKPTATKKRK